VSKPKKDPIQELRDKITKLHSEMKDLVIAAGVSEEEYAKPMHMLPNLNVELLASLEGWFRGIRLGPYAVVLDIWRQRPPNYWADLVAFGETNFPEQVQLRSAQKKLREAWRKQHGKPKRPKPEAEPDEAEATAG
jgi:hypothetical protein